MPARFLLGVFDTVYLVALTALVGSILFFSFAVAPIIFKVLGTDAGARFVRALFPRYYAWGAIAGAIALPSFVAVPLCYPEFRGAIVGVQAMLLLGCILIMLYAGNSLTPQINRARDGGASSQERFKRLHGRSVMLNTLVLAVGLGLLAAYANRPTPRTSGIKELGPVERARFDAELTPIMEQLETKYGLRRGGREGPGEPSRRSPSLDRDTLRELESYYLKKQERDLARAGRPDQPASPGSGPGATDGAAAALKAAAPPGSPGQAGNQALDSSLRP